MAVKRNLESEMRAAQQYAASRGGKLPSLTDPKERAAVYRMAYPPSGGLPAELQGTVDESLYSAGISQPTADPLPQTVGASNLQGLKDNVNTAAAGVEKTSQPNEALRVLQEAIRAKSGVMDQPLGTSKVFQEAGLTGMGSLNAALASQTQKFQDDYVRFQNTISQMAGTYKDIATAAANNYNMAYASYKDEVDRLQKIQDDLNDNAQAIKLAQINHDNDIELARLQAKLNPENAIKAADAGLELTDSGYLPTDRNTITSPSGNSYDWSTYNAVGTPDQQAAYIKSVQKLIADVGKLNTITDVANYINKMAPDSVVSADDIVTISEETGVGWEEMLGLLTKESNTGSSNVAKNNNNFGGITWSPTYQAAHPEVSKGSPRPASEGGNYVKFATALDGLRAQAEQFTKRKVATPTTVSGKLTPEVELQILGLVTELTKGKGDSAYKENVAEQARQLYREGNTLDDIKDMLKYANQSTALEGDYRNAAAKVSLNMPAERRENFLGEVDRNLQAGDTKAAIEYIKSQALDTKGVDEAKNLRGKERTVQFLNEIQADLKAYEAAGGKTNIFKGTTENILAKAGETRDPALRKIATKIATAIQSYRRSMTGVAFSAPENKEYKKMFPTISKVGEFNTSVISALQEVFTGDLEYFYKEAVGSKAYESLIKDDLLGKLSETSGQSSSNLSDEEAYAEYLKIINTKK